jgi:hypothetical protein
MEQIKQYLLSKNGILFIAWGWIWFIGYLSEYIVGSLQFSFQLEQFKHVLSISLPVLGFGFTALYIYWLYKIEFTANYRLVIIVWLSVLVAQILINLIQFNILHKIIFQLQHPIFMLALASGIVITGFILKYKLILIGGIIFAGLAFLSSYFNLHEQLLIEAIAWLVAFIIPGHILASTHEKPSPR